MPIEKPPKPFSRTLKILFFAAFALIGTIGGILYAQLQELPDITNLNDLKTSEATRIYDCNGNLITQLFQEQRTIVPLDKIPMYLQNAIIATEDERFYENWGIDPIGIARAFMVNLEAGGLREGASTITQQLARTLFLTQEKTLSRKIREALLSLQIEKNYSKSQILDMYLNDIYFGEGAYGVESAARSYFGKHLENLTLSECAMLAGLPKSPTHFDPYKFPLEALKRRSLVLDRMVANHYITEQEATDAKSAPIELKKIEVQNAPYFVEYVQQQLESRYGSNAVYKGGLSVYTTLDMKLQEAAQQAMAHGLENAEILARKDNLTNIPVDQPIQGALLAIDPHTGAIRAMIGGEDFHKSVFNRAIQAHRQPGSAFKPIIYAAAIENGYTMADVFLDSPVSFPDPATGKPWRPLNFSGKFRGPTTLHTALMHSINVVTVKLLDKLGVQPVINLARRLGITTPIKPNLTLALGTSEVTLEEMVQAYSVFDNQGVRVEPFGILTVKDASGHVLESNTPMGESVLSPYVAYIMVHTMKDVIDNGTGRIVRSLGFTYPSAGKTGTTNDNVDAWFIGFTPGLSCGVWVGYDQRQSLGRKQTGGETAAPIWAEFMKAATAGTSPENFPSPKNTDGELVNRKICLTTGLLAGPYCPTVRNEIFIKGTEPTKYCNVHVSPNGNLGNLPAGTNPSYVAPDNADILEMDSQPVLKISTPVATNSTPSVVESIPTPVIKVKQTGEPAYQDDGF